MKSQRMDIIKDINLIYENAECELKFSSNYELLVAVILSAQCTDKRVNIVTSELFKEYNTTEKMIRLSQAELAARMQINGVTVEREAISKIETGDRFVTDYELMVFAKVLGVTIEWLIEQDKDE